MKYKSYVYLILFCCLCFCAACKNKEAAEDVTATETITPTLTPTNTPTPTPTPIIINDANSVIDLLTEVADRTFYNAEKQYKESGGYDISASISISDKMKEELPNTISTALLNIAIDATETSSKLNGTLLLNDETSYSGETYIDISNHKIFLKNSLLPNKVTSIPMSDVISEEEFNSFLDSLANSQENLNKRKNFVKSIIDHIQALPDIKISSTIGNEKYSISGTEYCLAVDGDFIKEEFLKMYDVSIFSIVDTYKVNSYEVLEGLPFISTPTPTPTPVIEENDTSNNVIEFETPYGTGTFTPAEGVIVTVPEEENNEVTQEEILSTPIPSPILIPEIEEDKEADEEESSPLGTFYISFIKSDKDNSYGIKISNSLDDYTTLYFINTKKGGAFFIESLKENDTSVSSDITTNYIFSYTKEEFPKGYSGVVRFHNLLLEDVLLEVPYSVKNNVYNFYYEPDTLTSYDLIIDCNDGFIGTFKYQKENSYVEIVLQSENKDFVFNINCIEDTKPYFFINLKTNARPANNIILPIETTPFETWKDELQKEIDALDIKSETESESVVTIIP